MENVGQLASWYSEYGSIYIYIYIHPYPVVLVTRLPMFKQPNETRQSCKTSWMEVWPPSRSWSCDVRSARRDLRDCIFLGVWPLGAGKLKEDTDFWIQHHLAQTAQGPRPEAREIYFRRRRSMLQRPEDGNDGMLWNTWWRQNLPHAFPRAG